MESSERTSDVLTLSSVSPLTAVAAVSVDDDEALLCNLEFQGLLLTLLLIEEEAKASDVPLITAKPRMAMDTIMETTEKVELIVALVWSRHRIIFIFDTKR
jgi:hypothetical protein